MILEILAPIGGAFIFAVLVTVIILHALSDHEDDYEDYEEEEENGNVEE